MLEKERNMGKYGTAQVIEKTNNVYNVFKYVHKLNPERFRGQEINEVVSELIGFVKPTAAVSVALLKDRITMYSSTYDTGILF